MTQALFNHAVSGARSYTYSASGSRFLRQSFASSRTNNRVGSSASDPGALFKAMYIGRMISTCDLNSYARPASTSDGDTLTLAEVLALGGR